MGWRTGAIIKELRKEVLDSSRSTGLLSHTLTKVELQNSMEHQINVTWLIALRSLLERLQVGQCLMHTHTHIYPHVVALRSPRPPASHPVAARV